MPTQIDGLQGVDKIKSGTVETTDLQDNAVFGAKLFRFTSAEQNITSGADLVVPHGLGVIPFHVSALLKCVTAEYGYSVGDLIVANFMQQSSSAADTYGATLRVDATNVYVYYGNVATATLLAHNATTNAIVTLTNANWRLILKAEA